MREKLEFQRSWKKYEGKRKIHKFGAKTLALVALGLGQPYLQSQFKRKIYFFLSKIKNHLLFVCQKKIIYSHKIKYKLNLIYSKATLFLL
jgi:hypothetical protein